MKGLIKKLWIAALLLVPATSAYADTCQYKNVFSLAYPGTDYAVNVMGAELFLSTNQGAEGPTYNQDLSSLIANLNSDVTPQLALLVPVTGSWSMSGSVLRSPSFSSTVQSPPILPIGSYDGVGFYQGSPPLVRVCTPDPVVVTPSGGSNIMISVLDALSGNGVSGTSTLFSGSVGQIVIALIAVSLVGVILGAFWYLKRRAENGSD